MTPPRKTARRAGEELVILAIDPGLRVTGFGLIAKAGETIRLLDFGAFTVSSDLPLPERLRTLFEALEELILRWCPTELAIEAPFVAANKQVAVAMGEARALAMLAAAQAGLPVFSYSPGEVKQAVTGYGRGEKRQVQEMVRLQLGLEAIPQPDHAADALATAICHVAHRKAAAVLEGEGLHRKGDRS
jgi:crossover junction endodeoxyribonuclease RuvC